MTTDELLKCAALAMDHLGEEKWNKFPYLRERIFDRRRWEELERASDAQLRHVATGGPIKSAMAKAILERRAP